MLAGNIFSIRAPSGLPWSFRAIGFSGVVVVVPVAVVPVLVGVPVVEDVVVVGVVVPAVDVLDAAAFV
jgi:hypothetical protein